MFHKTDLAKFIFRKLLPLFLVWSVFVVLPDTLPGRRLELMGFDLLTVTSASERIDPPIVIVGIDDPSFAELNRQWPWPRSLHAQLTDALKSAGAAVIAFDVLFPEPSADDNDVRFADAIRRAGNVVLASDLVLQETGKFQQMMQLEPLGLLREAGARSGLATVRIDPDLIVRMIPQQQDALWREVVRLYEGDSPRRAPPGEMIRYLGPDHAFQYVSYYQALEPAKFLPPGIFRGKIVLIGNDVKAAVDAQATQIDAFATPYSSVTRLMTPGVELHATLIANGLARRAIHETPRAWQRAAVGFVVLLMTFGMGSWHALRNGLLALVLMVAIGALTAWLFVVHDIWLPSIAVLLSVAGMYAVQVVAGYLFELRQRRQIERAFRFYVAPEIVKEMTAHPDRLVLGGVRRELTLMFTDLAGFTNFSEQMQPEQVAELLNEHLTLMTRIVLDHGGTVDKFIGDAIMAFWGAPLADPESALHACQAAKAMQAEMTQFRLRYAGDTLRQLSMRIGIHSGPAVVGNMGSSDRFDYTAIGDNVNLAARLEGVNKRFGTDVLISQETAAEISDRILLRRVERVIVKGKTQPIDIFTFCDDPELVRLSEEALNHYSGRRWELSLEACRRILECYPEDKIAIILIAETEQLRRDPPPPDWNGGTALEKM